MAKVGNKEKRRVWIDSQTEEEIQRGIREAKPMSAYENLGKSGIMRTIEDYAMGINFSRVMSVKYGGLLNNAAGTRSYTAIAVGRVMTCVLGMVVIREREIRNFKETPFYRVVGNFTDAHVQGEWKAVEGSGYFASPLLYKENGFKEREPAENLIQYLLEEPRKAIVHSIEKKKENKNAPLLYNLAELQNDCSKYFKISPDETLRIAQELYGKKMTTYPRTDARVLSTAVSKEIHKNIGGLRNFPPVKEIAEHILQNNMQKGIEKTRYCNDKAITDHYAIIPTGQGFNNLKNLSVTAARTYEIIVRRFLSIFYPPAIYQKVSITSDVKNEKLYASFKVLVDEGYLSVAKNSFAKARNDAKVKDDDSVDNKEDSKCDAALFEVLKKYRKGSTITFNGFNIKEGETSPPKRYNSGSIILAMENAGQLIEDEELRAQIKGSGIGTSATRAEILKKLNTIKYISINSKTQIITPTFLGEIIYDVVDNSIRHLLNPELTASWEKGLTGVAEGNITADEYMEKLDGFVSRRTRAVMALRNQAGLIGLFNETAKNYK